jgi:hypothetical protein
MWPIVTGGTPAPGDPRCVSREQVDRPVQV